jgi:hypothetical protein
MHFALLLLQTPPNPEQAARIMAAVLPIIAVVTIMALIVFIVPFWFICKKAGFSPWLSMLNLLPLGSLVLIYILAFAEWKTVPDAPGPLNYPYPPTPPRT